jgi:hypothetical protein
MTCVVLPVNTHGICQTIIGGIRSHVAVVLKPSMTCVVLPGNAMFFCQTIPSRIRSHVTVGLSSPSGLRRLSRYCQVLPEEAPCRVASGHPPPSWLRCSQASQDLSTGGARLCQALPGIATQVLPGCVTHRPSQSSSIKQALPCLSLANSQNLVRRCRTDP